jgi:hypothetical protein
VKGPSLSGFGNPQSVAVDAIGNAFVCVDVGNWVHCGGDTATLRVGTDGIVAALLSRSFLSIMGLHRRALGLNLLFCRTMPILHQRR